MPDFAAQNPLYVGEKVVWTGVTRWGEPSCRQGKDMNYKVANLHQFKKSSLEYITSAINLSKFHRRLDITAKH